MYDTAYTFEVPDVTAGRHEQSLTRGNRVEADGALGSIDTRRIRLSDFGLWCRFGTREQALVCGRVEIVQALLPPTVALYANLDAAKDYLFTSFEVDAELNHISIIDGIWATLNSWA